MAIARHAPMREEMAGRVAAVGLAVRGRLIMKQGGVPKVGAASVAGQAVKPLFLLKLMATKPHAGSVTARINAPKRTEQVVAFARSQELRHPEARGASVRADYP